MVLCIGMAIPDSVALLETQARLGIPLHLGGPGGQGGFYDRGIDTPLQS